MSVGPEIIIPVVKLLRKPLEHLGLLLCRRRVAAIEHERAVLKNRLAEAERKRREVERENIAQARELGVLRQEAIRRDDFRPVDVFAGHVAFALRADRARPGDVPRLLYPVCFERGRTVDLVKKTRTVNKWTKFAYRVTYFKCPSGDCAYSFVTPVEAAHKAFKFAD